MTGNTTMQPADNQENAGQTGPGRGWQIAIALLACLLVLGSIGWAGDVFRRWFKLALYLEQFIGAMLGVALLLVFLVFPARRGAPRGAPAWYDVILGLLAGAAAFYIAVRFPVIGASLFARPPDGIAAAIILIIGVVEALRRTVGWPLVIVVLGFLAYGLFGHLMPQGLSSRRVGYDLLAFYTVFDQNAMLGTPLVVASTIVVPFVLFGFLLVATGGSRFFTDISLALMGRQRGGSAKIAIVGSGFFGSISGNAVSNVVATGVVTIPLMRSTGYPREKAGAIEAVASLGGNLMPPVMGAVAFLIAEFLQITYAEVITAALLPALLYYLALFIVADLEAARSGIRRVEEALIPRTMAVMAKGWHFPIPFFVLGYTLFGLHMRPETAALMACASLLVLGIAFGYDGERPGLRQVLETVNKTGTAVLDIIIICAAAGIVIGVLSLTGLGFSITLALVRLAENSLLMLLVLSAVVCIILGMGMPTVGVYTLLAALVAPALVEAGVVPIAAHMFILYFGMLSMLTPPVAIVAYSAASLAGAEPMRTAFESMRFGWIAYVIPFLFVFSPALLLIGEPSAIAFSVLTAVAGIWFISAAAVGFGFLTLGWLERIVYAVAGMMMLVPATAFEGAIYADIAGMALGLVLIGREIMRRRAAQAHSP